MSLNKPTINQSIQSFNPYEIRTNISGRNHKAYFSTAHISRHTNPVLLTSY